MNSWEDLLIYIIKAVAGAMVAFIIPFVFALIRSKIKDDKVAKIITRVENIVSKTVKLVNQTYVDALKENGMFDKEAQKAAFEMCKEKVLAMLNDEAIIAISETFGDYEEWIRTLIESYVRDNKLYFLEESENSEEAE